MDDYNICMKDELVDLNVKFTQRKNINDNFLFFPFKILKELYVKDRETFKEKDIFKEKANFFVFLLTKAYMGSKLFEKHIEEVNSLNKEVIILILEKNLVFNANIKPHKYKLFNISESFDEHFRIHDDTFENFIVGLKNSGKINKTVSSICYYLSF